MSEGKVNLKQTILAVDPGKAGGFAIRHWDGRTETIKMPATEGDAVETFRFLAHCAVAESGLKPVAVIEDVPAYAGKPQAGASAFKFGRNVGFLEGCLMSQGYRLERVRPQRWQTGLGLRRNGESPTGWKAKLRGEAQRLYPDLKVTNATADALLLLEWKINH